MSHIVFAIHVVPLEPALYPNDVDEYRKMTNEDLADLALGSTISMIFVDDDALLAEADWNPDSEDATAVFVCDSEAQCVEEAYEFLRAQRTFAEFLHSIHTAF